MRRGRVDIERGVGLVVVVGGGGSGKLSGRHGGKEDECFRGREVQRFI